jgi:glucose-6-phosphate 1-dehydrogenase
MWNREYIESVEVRAKEQVNVGTRGEFYDATGALRDMIQSHVHQLLALTAMEPPARLTGDAFRDAKAAVLRAAKTLTPDEVMSHVVRAQYTEGNSGGERVPGYRNLDEVAPNSTTETYVAIRTEIENERWQGVPFSLISGKALSEKDTSISVTFKKLSPQYIASLQTKAPELYEHLKGRTDDISANLTIQIDPKPGVRVEIEDTVVSYFEDHVESAELGPYARLIDEAAQGDHGFFVRADELSEMWEKVDAIRLGWSAQPVTDLPTYPAGSQGPAAAQALLKKAATPIATTSTSVPQV